MTKVPRIIIDFSFLHIPINRKENSVSVATLKKVGFVYEASMKNYRYSNNDQSHGKERS